MINFNMDEFQRTLQGVSTQIGFSATNIVKEQAEKIMEESKNQVPVDTGALASTAYVAAEPSFIAATAEFGYTGEATNERTGQQVSDYMIEVHERLDVVHPVGKAKFLEDPVNQFADELEETLGSKVADLLVSIFRR